MTSSSSKNQAAASAQRPGSTKTLLRDADGVGAVRRTVLPGGLRVITENMPSVRSATFGIWVGVGSRDETPALAGTSHYLEHLLFKGTEKRDALEISAELDAVGGEMNAFTTKEYTCYYARVLDSDLPLAIDVICDMVTSSLIESEDVDAERGVILEEIAMNEDEPGDLVHELFYDAMLADAPLGRPVLGTVESINALTRTQINGYYKRRYRAPNMVVTAAGNVEHAKVVRLVKKAFAHVRVDENAVAAAPRTGGRAFRSTGNVRLMNRPTEQAHLVLGMPGLARDDDRRFTLSVLNTALGGGMSSRLFQEIREKRGLAYSVYSFHSGYADLGVFGIYAGCQPKKARQVIDICRTELDKVVREGLPQDEIDRAIGQLRGSTVLGLEDTGSRMSRIGKSELVYGEHLSVDEVLARIGAVTAAEVHEVAKNLFAARPTLAVVGPFADDADFVAAST
ncbi:M16 family metallopeptidase [Embleya sp. NBC_00896]|uniref:M16 family metallopeptidase n=1 Tax=Embleya sp. NBC_00896 TaxID=2975961 RepID=UPI00386CFD3D|nr:insulinase family protein [Embleya sp. NBC_00896]